MVISAFIAAVFFLYFAMVSWVNKFWSATSKTIHKTETSLDVTVIIPVKNEEANIGKCLQSIIDQNIEGFKIIVINDHSEDYTESVVKNISDPRIEFLNLPLSLAGKKQVLLMV